MVVVGHEQPCSQRHCGNLERPSGWVEGLCVFGVLGCRFGALGISFERRVCKGLGWSSLQGWNGAM